MRKQHLFFLAPVMGFALLAALAFCSTEDAPPNLGPTTPLQLPGTGG
ncbi:hypothetical protein [Phyllobacterium chamaecytisi]|nr:hypothetical protein [Phyllobacterium sp. KW56]MBZ9605053.1 hypothetical protein [Phyllobacterium sp. KW56]